MKGRRKEREIKHYFNVKERKLEYVGEGNKMRKTLGRGTIMM